MRISDWSSDVCSSDLKLLLSIRTSDKHGTSGHMKLLAVDRSVGALFRMLGATWRGPLGPNDLAGVHFQQGDDIRIEGARSNDILAGEIYEATGGNPLTQIGRAPRRARVCK